MKPLVVLILDVRFAVRKYLIQHSNFLFAAERAQREGEKAEVVELSAKPESCKDS